MFWTGLRWEIRSSSIAGTLLYYLNLAYTPGDPIPSPNGNITSEWIFVDQLAFGTDLVSTNTGACCNCLTIQFAQQSTYTGTYVDCTGAVQNWVISEAGEPYINICTSELESVTYPTPEEGGPDFEIGLNPCQSEVVGDPPEEVFNCAPICVSFIGGLGFDEYDINNVDAYPTGIINGKVSYILQTPAPSSTTLYIYWSIVDNRWEIISDINNPSTTLIAYLLDSTSSSYPIGLSWECVTNDNLCWKQGYGNIATRKTCDEIAIDCMCITFKLNDLTPGSSQVTYTDCNDLLITETITITDINERIRRCVKLGTVIVIAQPLVITAVFTRMCDPRFDNCIDFIPA
jgi:hypothetical protein